MRNADFMPGEVPEGPFLSSCSPTSSGPRPFQFLLQLQLQAPKSPLSKCLVASVFVLYGCWNVAPQTS